MSFPLTPSKRSFDHSPQEPNGRGKWQKSASFNSQQRTLKVSTGSTIFRLLCPVNQTGSVIGKGGGIVRNIRKETGARISVEETVPGCDERVVVIIGSDRGESNNKQKKDENANDASENIETGDDDNEENKEVIPIDDQTEKPMPSAQKALLRVFERIVEGDNENAREEAMEKSSIFVLRLLVFCSQVGCVLGKGGSVIKQMATESGAQIRILPRDKLPAYASPSDELIQITGEFDAVRKALLSVSTQLLENPPREHDSLMTGNTKPGNLPHLPFLSAPPENFPPSNYPFPAQDPPYMSGIPSGSDYLPNGTPSVPRFHEDIPQLKSSPDILSFRLLCTDEKVGGVIGKGGSIVKTLQNESGCEIKVMDPVPDSPDRVIVISGPVHPDERISAAQDGALRVQNRIIRAAPDNKEKTVLARILVTSNQIGCILGKGGSVIAEMRKHTGAHIRILAKDQNPKCAAENEEVVQISGEFETVQEALLQVTTKLRQHFFRDRYPSANAPPRPPFPDDGPPFMPHMGRRDTSPPGMYHNVGSYRNFEGNLPPHDERSAFGHGNHRPGLPHGSERFSSSLSWPGQGINDSGGPMPTNEFSRGPQRMNEGFTTGSQPAVITNTTVEVVVPRALVPSICGEDGECLNQIRQISGARITITEPRQGVTETVVIISGNPEQTHAAQSLLQAFVISGSSSP